MRGRLATKILSATTSSHDLAYRTAKGVHLVGCRKNDLYFKRLDRVRMGLISSMGRLWKSHFNGELEKTIAEAEAFDDPLGWRSAIEAGVTRHWKAGTTFEQMYVTVFPLIAERVFDGLTSANLSKTFGRGFEQKADPELILAWERAAIDFIRGEGGELITNVELFSHRLVVRHVRRLTEQAVTEGWSINRLKREFQRKITSLNDWRSRMIARTETMRSANLGSREAALSTSLDLIKEWLIAPLGTGDRHATLEYSVLHGQTRDMQALYEFKGHSAMYPLDLRLPADESINCRCSERYIPKDMADAA